GRFVGLHCMRGPADSMWDKWTWTRRIRGWFVRPEPFRCDNCLILLDAVRHNEVARLPAQDALMSRDGRVLVTLGKDELVSVWDLPLRKSWDRILGFAALGTFMCSAVSLVLRLIVRRFSRSRAFDRTSTSPWN